LRGGGVARALALLGLVDALVEFLASESEFEPAPLAAELLIFLELLFAFVLLFLALGCPRQRCRDARQDPAER
jgi:hypothetical protein